jgi:hypothetical protein
MSSPSSSISLVTLLFSPGKNRHQQARCRPPYGFDIAPLLGWLSRSRFREPILDPPGAFRFGRVYKSVMDKLALLVLLAVVGFALTRDRVARLIDGTEPLKTRDI